MTNHCRVVYLNVLLNVDIMVININVFINKLISVIQIVMVFVMRTVSVSNVSPKLMYILSINVKLLVVRERVHQFRENISV